MEKESWIWWPTIPITSMNRGNSDNHSNQNNNTYDIMTIFWRAASSFPVDHMWHHTLMFFKGKKGWRADRSTSIVPEVSKTWKDIEKRSLFNQFPRKKRKDSKDIEELWRFTQCLRTIRPNNRNNSPGVSRRPTLRCSACCTVRRSFPQEHHPEASMVQSALSMHST